MFGRATIRLGIGPHSSTYLLRRSIGGIGNSSPRRRRVTVNNQHDIKRRGQDFDKKFVFERVHGEEVGRRIS